MAELWIAFALCFIWGIMLIVTVAGSKRMPKLPSELPLPARLPLVSVIVAAKEEQQNIQETIQNLLAQTYPKLEIIAVNDRSLDATGAKLDALKSWSDGKERWEVPLKVIHITHLPAGWMGKNHALYQGYLQAKGTMLLFTDADVRFEPNTIRDAVAYAFDQRADHVTLIPKLVANSFWLRAFIHYFLFCLCLVVPPWAGNNDRQDRRGIGVGAFNLIRREAYEDLGTHRAFPMRPEDDIHLGMLVKRGGWRQRVASGVSRISVEWYGSYREAMLGLEKNLYSGFRYRLWGAALAVLGQLSFFVMPFAALIWSRGFSLILLLFALAFLIGTYLRMVKTLLGHTGKEALFLPVSVVLFLTVLIRSVWLAHRRKGVYWRGTFYSLKEMRNHFRSGSDST